MHDKNVIKLTEQEAVLLEQAASMLEGLENDERNRGNCSTAEGAGCSAHAVRRLASALLAHEREIGQCLHQIAEPAHPTACTVEEVRAFEAAAAPAAVAAPDSSNLGFAVEQRGDVWVVVEDAGGVCPASSHECALWNALIEARAALAAAPAAPAPSQEEAEIGMAWYNSCTEAERAKWHGLAGSAVPADAYLAFQAAQEASAAFAAPVVLPSGWVPCIVTYEGQHPEEVAYGPQVMMDRLKKWLERYFELKAAAPVVLPEPVREALEEAESVLNSINNGDQHAVKVGDEVCYWQRQEWIDWAKKEVLPKVRAALLAGVSAPAAFGDEDHVSVPRSLIGAACAAIDKKRDGVKTLAELRRYTTGDLSAAVPAAPAVVQTPVLYVSKGQLDNHRDPAGPDCSVAGRYLPARITPAGKFTTPLFAAPQAPAADALDAARYRYLRDEHIGDDPGSINLAPARKRGLDSAIDAAIAAQAAAQGE